MIDPARSFDRAAADYEAARPGYPDGLVALLPLAGAVDVLDLGAGTGKLTRMLVRHFAHVVAVEPLDGMRAILESVVPEADSRAGSAEAIPAEDATVDAVLAAQAFHWFTNDEAIGEIARVLRDGGIVCAVWNESTGDSPLPQSYHDYMEELHAPSLETLRAGPKWEEVVARGPFGAVHAGSVEHEQVQDRDAVLAFARSVSWVAGRPDAERVEIMARLERMLPEGDYRFRLKTELRWAGRSPR